MLVMGQLKKEKTVLLLQRIVKSNAAVVKLFITFQVSKMGIEMGKIK